MTQFLLDLLTSYHIEEDQSYNLYIFRNDDAWPWGLVGTYRDTGRLVQDFMSIKGRPYTAGLWITIESGDGVIDHTVFKSIRHFNGLQLSMKGDAHNDCDQ